MPKINLDAIPMVSATGYPAEYADVVQGRWYRRLGPATGLSEFGVSHVTLKPGGWSAQRHWHEDEDEFAVMLSGEAMLIDDSGRTPMRPGDCASFPKNDGNGHCLINESDRDCVFVVVGRPPAGQGYYPDIDMQWDGAAKKFLRKDGSDF